MLSRRTKQVSQTNLTYRIRPNYRLYPHNCPPPLSFYYIFTYNNNNNNIYFLYSALHLRLRALYIVKSTTICKNI